MKVQGLCVICKTNKQANKGKSYGYRPYCERCNKYKVEKKICQICDFIPEHVCQMDVHHIDSDHLNNDLANLQVLCANCHRLQHCKIFG